MAILLGTTSLLAGEPHEAERAAAEALALARERGERGNEGWALLLTGDVTAARGEGALESAVASYREALASAEDLEMRPLAARCRLALAAVHVKLARHGAAMKEISAASAEFGVMGMVEWRGRAARLQATLHEPRDPRGEGARSADDQHDR
jgi:ATP/maltotriose-dependent transcriptional regulator MalT